MKSMCKNPKEQQDQSWWNFMWETSLRWAASPHSRTPAVSDPLPAQSSWRIVKAPSSTGPKPAPEGEWMQDLIKIKSCFNASWSVCVSRSMVHGLTRELVLYLWGPRTISFEGVKSWVNSVHIGSDTSCSFFPLLLYSACIYSSLFVSTLFFLLYLLHPSDSFPFSSLLFSCSLFKCNCPKFNCSSWYRISWEGH